MIWPGCNEIWPGCNEDSEFRTENGPIWSVWLVVGRNVFPPVIQDSNFRTENVTDFDFRSEIDTLCCIESLMEKQSEIRWEIVRQWAMISDMEEHGEIIGLMKKHGEIIGLMKKLWYVMEKIERLTKQEFKKQLRLLVWMVLIIKRYVTNILEKKRGILHFQLWNEEAIALVLWICGDVEVNPGPKDCKSVTMRKFMRYMQMPLLLRFYEEKKITKPRLRDLYKCKPPGWTGKYFVNISNKKSGGQPSDYEIFDDILQVLEQAEIEMDPVLQDYKALRSENNNESESKSRLQRLQDFITLNQIEKKITNNNPDVFRSQLLQQEQMMKQGKFVPSEEDILQIERLLQTAKSTAASKRKRGLTDRTDSDRDENSPRLKATRMDDENNQRIKSTPCKDSSVNNCQEQPLQNAEDDTSTSFYSDIDFSLLFPSDQNFDLIDFINAPNELGTDLPHNGSNY